MTDQTPATEALLLQGLEAAFSTSGGNVQTPRAIFDFLRISYLPAIEAEARASLDVDVLAEALTLHRVRQRENGTDAYLDHACMGDCCPDIAAIYDRLAENVK